MARVIQSWMPWNYRFKGGLSVKTGIVALQKQEVSGKVCCETKTKDIKIKRKKKMNKIEFYDGLLEEVKRRVNIKEIREAHDGVRGNLAYYCDLCDHDYYARTLETLKTLSTNDFCWHIYLNIHNHVMKNEMTSEQQELIESEFVITKTLYKLGNLESFECVFSKDYPEWFLVKEELDRLKKI